MIRVGVIGTGAMGQNHVRIYSEMDGVELEFEDEVLEFIVDKAIEFKLGARGLRSICETIMMDVMFDMPEEKNLVISLDYARLKLESDVADRLRAA